MSFSFLRDRFSARLQQFRGEYRREYYEGKFLCCMKQMMYHPDHNRQGWAIVDMRTEEVLKNNLRVEELPITFDEIQAFDPKRDQYGYSMGCHPASDIINYTFFGKYRSDAASSWEAKWHVGVFSPTLMKHRDLWLLAISQHGCRWQDKDGRQRGMISPDCNWMCRLRGWDWNRFCQEILTICPSWDPSRYGE